VVAVKRKRARKADEISFRGPYLHIGSCNIQYIYYYLLYQNYNIIVESRIVCFRRHWHGFHHHIRDVDETQ